MSPPTTASPSQLPDYIASAKPNPPSNRAPWYKNTAPTYAGIFLWFIFWDSIAGKALMAGGLGATLLGILLAGLICHFLFYLVPGLLGRKTGLPLYIVGTSTFGAMGGLFMPGLLMGLLQFGWLGVNTFGAADYLANKGFHVPALYQVRKIRALLFHRLCRLGKIDWASESHQELDRCLSRAITASKNFND